MSTKLVNDTKGKKAALISQRGLCFKLAKQQSSCAFFGRAAGARPHMSLLAYILTHTALVCV